MSKYLTLVITLSPSFQLGLSESEVQHEVDTLTDKISSKLDLAKSQGDLVRSLDEKRTAVIDRLNKVLYSRLYKLKTTAGMA